MSDTLLFEQHGAIGTLTFNRPNVFNAMNDELILALRDTTASLLSSTTLRAMIVKGAGKAFLAGGDVGLFYQRLDAIADEVKPMGDSCQSGFQAK